MHLVCSAWLRFCIACTCDGSSPHPTGHRRVLCTQCVVAVACRHHLSKRDLRAASIWVNVQALLHKTMQSTAMVKQWFRSPTAITFQAVSLPLRIDWNAVCLPLTTRIVGSCGLVWAHVISSCADKLMETLAEHADNDHGFVAPLIACGKYSQSRAEQSKTNRCKAKQKQSNAELSKAKAKQKQS